MTLYAKQANISSHEMANKNNKIIYNKFITDFETFIKEMINKGSFECNYHFDDTINHYTYGLIKDFLQSKGFYCKAYYNHLAEGYLYMNINWDDMHVWWMKQSKIVKILTYMFLS